MIFIFLNGMATNYFVSASTGNDGNNGTSAGTAWRTTNKVSTFPLLPGDSVFFNRGDIFAGVLTAPASGTISSRIVFSYYGTGAKPTIDATNTLVNCINTNNKKYITFIGLRCINANGSNEFTASINLGPVTIEGIVIMDCTIEFNRRSGIVTGGNSFSPAGAGYLFLRDTIRQNGDFGILGQNVKPFPDGSSLISYCILDSNGLKSLADAREVGNIQGNFGGVEIKHCDISHAAPGSAKDDLTSHGIYVSGPTRSVTTIDSCFIHDIPNGDAIKARYSVHDYGNTIWNIHHIGVELGENVDTDAHHFTHNENIYNGSLGQPTQAFPGIGLNNPPQGIGHVTSVRIENNTVSFNTFTTSGNEISANYSPDTLIIQNNIIRPNGTRPAMNIVAQTGFLVIDYNDYWWASAPFSSTYGGSTKTLSGWKALGFETHGLNVDPLLVSTTDFHLTSGSPCRGTGTNVGFGTDMGALPFATTLITPDINWSPANMVYGNVVGPAQLNPTATVSGSPVSGMFLFSPQAGFAPPVGPLTLNTNWTPNDPTSYTPASKSVTITVSPAPSTLTASGTTVTFNNSPQAPIITTSPPGLSYNLLINGVAAPVTNVGVYSFTVGNTDPNHTATPISGTFTINKGTAIISASNVTVNFDGKQHTIVATTTPNVTGLTATYTGISGTTYGPSSTPPSAIGTYRVDFTLSNANYSAAPISATLTIVSNPAIIFISDTIKTYNTFQQGVTVTSAYTYTVTYNGSATLPTNANTGITVIATITDGIHTGADTAIMVINKRQAILSYNKPPNAPYGTIAGPLQQNATASISGAFSYTPVAGFIYGLGSNLLTAAFTPSDTANNLGGTVSTTIDIFPQNPFNGGIYITNNFFLQQ